MSDSRFLPLILTLILAWTLPAAGIARTGSPCGWNDDQVQAAVQAVDTLLAAESWEEAARLARGDLRRHPDCPVHTWQFEQRLGLALHKMGHAAEALPYLESAVRNAPHEAANHLNLAAALMALGRKGRALSEFEEALTLEPDSWRIHLDYGQALQQFRMFAAALPEVLTAERLCERCLESTRALASLYLEMRDYAGAAPPLEKLYSLQPEPSLRHNLALASLRSGQPGRVRELLAPGWPGDLAAEDRILLLEADRMLHDSGRAVQLAALAAAPEPVSRDPVLWGLAALMCLESGDLEPGLAAADVAIALDPGNPTYRNNRVVLLTRLERHEEAQEEWQRVLQLAPDLAEDPK
jgi:tetratricopeptide (TPR) repeat protein